MGGHCGLILRVGNAQIYFSQLGCTDFTGADRGTGISYSHLSTVADCSFHRKKPMKLIISFKAFIYCEKLRKRFQVTAAIVNRTDIFSIHLHITHPSLDASQREFTAVFVKYFGVNGVKISNSIDSTI